MRSKNPPEKRKKAVALRYDPQKDGAPRVVAKGSGIIADKILDVARQHALPVHQDPQMVEVLAKVPIDAQIPENLYRAVAEVLAFVYRLDASQK